MTTTPASPRTLFTTLVGLVVILAGGLASMFSLFALALALGKPYATSRPEPLAIFLIFILPPGTLLAGIGLLLRHRWARWWIILLMVGLIAFGVRDLLAPGYADSAYAPVPGPVADSVEQTVFFQAVGCVAVGSLILLGLFSPRVRREFQPATKSSTEATPPAVPAAVLSPSPAREAQVETKGGLLLPILFFGGITVGSLWLAISGLQSGETKLLAKYTNHLVTRAEEPVLFWISIATFSGLGLFVAATGAWLAWAILRRR